MKLLSNRRHRIAAGLTAAALAVGGGSATVALATAPVSAGAAAAGTASLSATTEPAAAAVARHHRGLLARSDHAAFEMKVKGQWVTFDLDRGNVTSVSATSISLTRPDGQSVTLTINTATRFGRVASAGAVEVGVRATVISENGTARRVIQARRGASTAAPSASTPPA